MSGWWEPHACLLGSQEGKEGLQLVGEEAGWWRPFGKLPQTQMLEDPADGFCFHVQLNPSPGNRHQVLVLPNIVYLTKVKL